MELYIEGDRGTHTIYFPHDSKITIATDSAGDIIIDVRNPCGFNWTEVIFKDHDGDDYHYARYTHRERHELRIDERNPEYTSCYLQWEDEDPLGEELVEQLAAQEIDIKSFDFEL